MRFGVQRSEICTARDLVRDLWIAPEDWKADNCNWGFQILNSLLMIAAMRRWP
jgi:hypothetical protein